MLLTLRRESPPFGLGPLRRHGPTLPGMEVRSESPIAPTSKTLSQKGTDTFAPIRRQLSLSDTSLLSSWHPT